ncbi:MAG TPA: histidine kinase [Blastocatellia bacterium]|nr:histidine kinase [Blastocatellia bacterium]HMV83617.1 histidine kinase [Blastocatellia bacterium]HMX26988.1 histidine kinase [Blastocatellia bacterium]HMY72799.1 histidine kinase [Blastocatellia bacterium]HMZ20616.1 histidine kinase [Blastocatellia bacterium]
MESQHIAALVNLLGFITGTTLYGMLLIMVVRSVDSSTSAQRSAFSDKQLLLATALLGLLWNLGALVIYGIRDWNLTKLPAWFDAAVYAALGFLPAVVVHSVLRAEAGLARQRGAQMITAAAYALSAGAGLLHFSAAVTRHETPSPPALRALTFGFSALTVALLIYARRSSVWKRALWVVALAVFAVSALHLSSHTSGDAPWFIELIGHHASLPLVLAMLYQDYRFALADIFLKRALALVALVTLAFGLYVMVAVPLLRVRDAKGDLTPAAVGALFGLWLGTALIYPYLRQGVVWFVDAIVLRRADYQKLLDEMARAVASTEDAGEILDQACALLAPALSAREIRRQLSEENVAGSIASVGDDETASEFLLPSRLVRVAEQDGETSGEPRRRTGRLRLPAATVLIPTHEQPRYSLVIGELSAGRQLLSDDVAMLESVSLMLARRIDAARVTHERCARNLREQEIGKLATEAELRALRAQLNPHFLFNALTTISYLIQTAPARALETMMQLTGLLRAVLRAPSGELATLGEEMDLLESYLAIERARFEERLRVEINVPSNLRNLRIPPLIVQPLVENAVKHGIAPSKSGGELILSAWLEPSAGQFGEELCLSVRDTGAGVSDVAFEKNRLRGVGLANVERRLECFFGEAASLHFHSAPGTGATAEIRIPIAATTKSVSAASAQRASLSA